MYRCECCNVTSPPRATLRKFLMYRTVVDQRSEELRKEIAREVRCCSKCQGELEAGARLKDLMVERRPDDVKPAPPMRPDYKPRRPIPAYNPLPPVLDGEVILVDELPELLAIPKKKKRA